MNVLHLIAKFWQNIKKDNRENRAREIEGERQLLIRSLALSWPKKTPSWASFNPKSCNQLQKKVYTVLSFIFPGDTEYRRKSEQKICNKKLSM